MDLARSLAYPRPLEMGENTGLSMDHDAPGEAAVRFRISAGSMVFGACVFTFAGPLVAALTWPVIMGAIWIVQGNSPSEPLQLCAEMAPLIYAGSFCFLLFVPATLTGAVMGFLGTRFARRKTIWCGIAAGLLVSAGWVFVRYRLLGLTDAGGDISGVDAITLLNAPGPSAVLSW